VVGDVDSPGTDVRRLLVLIDPSNPSKSSGIQSPCHCAHCPKFRAVACGTMGHHAGCCFQFRGKQGWLNHLCCSSSLRLTEFGLEIECSDPPNMDSICLVINALDF